MEHKLELSETSINDFIDKLSNALNESAETAMQSFQEFIDSVKEMTTLGSTANFEEPVQRIVSAIMGEQASNMLTQDELNNAVAENIAPVSQDVTSIGEDTSAISETVAVTEEETGALVETAAGVASDTSSLAETGTAILDAVDSSDEGNDVLQSVTLTGQSIEESSKSIQENTNTIVDTLGVIATNTGTYTPISTETFLSGISNIVDSTKLNFASLLENIQANTLNSLNALSGNIVPKLENISQKDYSVNVNIKYDKMLEVKGNVDSNTLPKLQSILQQSCAYTKREIYSELTQRGLFRRF